MKRLLLTLQFMFICIISLANENYPIIFVNGHSSGANAEAGVRHWNPSSGLNTAMTRIESQRYDGYQYGLKSDGDPAKDCDMNTNLNPTPDSKRIYNFSYYHPNGQRGVISLNDDSVLVYIKWVYDVLGRPIPAVIAPFDPNYPPSNYDSTTYYPKYSPHLSLQNIPGHGLMWIVKSVTSEYVKSWKKGKFAKRLSLFIDKVLSATGAPKVDIVAYSMGGLVARTAIKNYGCASKVRKLLTVGAPNHYYDWAMAEKIWLHFVSDDPAWMQIGEDWEMSADAREHEENITFRDVNTGIEQPFTEFLDVEPSGDIYTIAGNKGYNVSGHPNDKVVEVDQVYLNEALANDVIYATHSYEGNPEEALTTCFYTTKTIMKWMIGMVCTEEPMDISPVLKDINVDGKQEIFLACDDGDGDEKRRVYVHDIGWNLLWSKDTKTVRDASNSEFTGTGSRKIERKYKEIGVGMLGAIFKSTRQHENALESWNPIVSGKISLRDQNLHLCCIFSYYFPMYTDYIRIIDNGVPISVTYHLEVWECNLLLASFLYDCKNITFSFGNGIIIGYGALNSSMSGHSMDRSFFYPLSFGVSLNSSFTFSFRKNISITLDINAKHYVFMKRNEPSFKVEGITGGVGLEYYFPIPKRG